jgi:signal recognition particle subunit SEC65
VYIGWVRRSLIAASIVLVLIFVYQQGVILKRIEVISRQTVVVDKENVQSPADEIENLLMAYRNSGRRFPSKTITISEKQMKELLESVNELQIKYKDLENLFEQDPELKKIVEKKLEENNRTKIKL